MELHFGWSPDSPKVLEEYLKKARVQIIQDPITVKYNPNEEDMMACVEFGEAFGKKFLVQT